MLVYTPYSKKGVFDMKNNVFSSLDAGSKKIIYDALSFSKFLDGKKIYGNKQKDFSFEEEVVLLDEVDKKVISLLFGILNNENSTSKYLFNKNITLDSVLGYLNVSDYVLEPVKIKEVDVELLNLVKLNLGDSLDVVGLALTLFRKFSCNSDIVYSYFYSSIAKDRQLFNEIKEDLVVLQKINMINFVNSDMNFESLMA